MDITNVVIANLLPIGGLFCALVTGVLGAFMSYRKPEHKTIGKSLFLVAAFFFIGAFVLGAADKIKDSTNRREQRDSLLDLRARTDDLLKSIQTAQNLINRLKPVLDDVSRQSNAASTEIKSIEASAKQVSANLDSARKQIADSLDKTAEQISAQIKQNSAILRSEVRKSRDANNKKIEEFTANSDQKADQLNASLRGVASSIRNQQIMGGNHGAYGFSGEGYNTGNGYPLPGSGTSHHFTVPIGRGMTYGF